MIVTLYIVKFTFKSSSFILFSCLGCRNALVNMEARPINTPVLTRRCIITKLADLTAVRYRDMMEQSAGGLLILIPKELSTLPQEVIKVFIYDVFTAFFLDQCCS